MGHKVHRRMIKDEIWTESDTENLFRNFYGDKTFIEKASIPEYYGFKSKNNKNKKGYPDFFLDRDKYCVVVEAKGIEKNNAKAKSECKYYMINNVIKGKDLIGIAISVNEQHNPFITYFIKKDGKDIVELPIKELISLKELEKEYNKLYLKTCYEKMIGKIDNINTFFDTNTDINVNNRPIMFSALIIAMKDADFVFNERQSIKTINEEIYNAIKRKFVKKVEGNISKYDATTSFMFINTINVSCSLDKYKKFLNDFKEDFSKFYETTKYYDVIGSAYTKFLQYVQKEGGQDVVLTPDHIKSFMYKLGNIKYDDVILDICTGTAGFLATGFGVLLEKNKAIGKNVELESETYRQIANNQLIGVEFLPNIYTLAFSNMVLHGDGRSNLYKGDSLENFEIESGVYFEDIIEKLKPTFGILNPPYGDDQAIVFINRTLDLLQKRSKLVVICPSNTLAKNYKGLTDEILSKATLESVIYLSNCFAGQKIGTNPSIFIFRKEPHDNENIYFYDFTDDGFRYSIRKDENKEFDKKEKEMLEQFFKKERIRGISYFCSYKINKSIENIREKCNENPNNIDYDKLQYIREVDDSLKKQNFIDTVMNYYIYEVNCARNT